MNRSGRRPALLDGDHVGRRRLGEGRAGLNGVVRTVVRFVVRVVETFRSAWTNLTRHTGRSSLVALSTALGAATLVVLQVLGDSTVSTLVSGVEAVGGKHVLLVFETPNKRGSAALYDKGVSFEDAARLRARVPGIARVEYFTERSNQTAVVDGRGVDVDVGIGAPYRSWVASGMATGRDVSDEHAAREVVLCNALARDWFGSAEAAIHGQVLLWNHAYRVVGVAGEKGHLGLGVGGLRKQKSVFVSAAAASAEGIEESGFIAIVDDGTVDHALLKRTVEPLLAARHAGESDFEIIDFAAQLRNFEAFFVALRILSAVLSSMALLIAGTGIANTLLASVHERTSELGICRALGATIGDVRREVLSESALIGALGGLAGALAGFVAAYGASALVVRFVPEWSAEVNPWTVPVATLVSTVMGTVVGLYPARLASQLSVIECLRQRSAG